MALVMFLVIALTASIMLLPFWAEVLRMAGHMETNFRGRSIPQSMGGLLIPVFALSGAWALLTGLLPAGYVARALVVVAGLGLLGLTDDIWGDGKSRGFGGHFRRLFRQGELSTGVVKAAGGFLVSVFAVAGLPGFFLLVFWRAALVALSANLFNLLDLRPGRSLKAFFLASLVYAFFVRSEAGVLLLFPAWLAALTYLPWDLKGRGMLGDAGANAFGGLLGLVVVLTAPAAFHLAWFGALAAVHVAAERVSLTALIHSNRFLNFIDMLGREGREK